MRAHAPMVLFLALLCSSAAFADEAALQTIPPPPPEQFGYPGNIGPSRGWYVWHKFNPHTWEVDVSRDPPAEHWTAKVIPWVTTYRSLGYGAHPTELLPGERVNISFNPDGKTKWGYVVHFQDEICQMRGHNHAWQIRDVEPGNRWFRASVWAGHEKKLFDAEWSFWIDIDCEKWRDGKIVEDFPIKPEDHVWMTWVWQNGQRVVKRILDGPSCDVLKTQQERRIRWRVVDKGLPGKISEIDGATVKLLLYSNGWAQARQFKAGQAVELLPNDPERGIDANPKKLPATIESVKFGGTYGSGPTDVVLKMDNPPSALTLNVQNMEKPIALRLLPTAEVAAARKVLLTAINNQLSLSSPKELAQVTAEALKAQIAEMPEGDLKAKMNDLQPELERAAFYHARVRSLRAACDNVRGKTELTPSGPEWLRDLVGNERMLAFDRVSVVDLHDKSIAPKSGQRNTAVDDKWIERLKDFPDIEYLELQSTAVTDAGMKTVGTLKSLKRLSVTLLPVTGEGIKELAGMTDLRRLSIASTKCTGEGFSALKPLQKLENLNFHSCLVNDAGLKEVGTLDTLERLEIVHTKFTDAGAEHLSGLKNLKRLQIGSRDATGAAIAPVKSIALRELDLHDGQASDEGLEHASAIGTLRVLRVYGPVSDAAIKHLAKLDRLETLVLSHAKLTDKGLSSLHALKRLTTLDITGCKVSDDAVKALQAAVAGVVVTR